MNINCRTKHASSWNHSTVNDKRSYNPVVWKWNLNDMSSVYISFKLMHDSRYHHEIKKLVVLLIGIAFSDCECPNFHNSQLYIDKFVYWYWKSRYQHWFQSPSNSWHFSIGFIKFSIDGTVQRQFSIETNSTIREHLSKYTWKFTNFFWINNNSNVS